jgi:N-acetylmuramoyl-L-alanine amidase
MPEVMSAAGIERGATGEAVRDLQRRLAAAGHDTSVDEPGEFGLPTEAAVRAFQEERRLDVDGVCGPQTWAALVESGFALGDRTLYFRQPMLRGDDVTELQRQLNSLGFDAGREDGILGEQTAVAVAEFQRNVGLAPDGFCGWTTVAALRRVGKLAAGSVASVREREMLRRGPHGLGRRRVFITAAPGFEALGDAVCRGLAEAGAGALLDTAGSDDSTTAAAANQFGAGLVLALRAGSGAADRGCRCTYFSSGTFRSEAGFRVAAAVQHELRGVLPTAPEPTGKAYGVLRETRMAAVVCELVERGDVAAMRNVVARAGDVSRAIVRGVRRGVGEEPES